MRALSFYGFSVLSLCIIMVLAAGGIMLPQAAQAEETAQPDRDMQAEASRFIQKLGDEVVVTLAEHKDDRPAIEAELFDLLSKNIDVEHIARLVVGKYWPRATDDQRQRFIESYRPFLVKTYSQRFSAYSGEKFVISDTREEARNTVLVRSEIKQQEGEPIPVDFRVRPENGKLKVFDVIVAGVSQLQTQRSEFYSIIERNGLDNLIARLDKRVQQLTERARG